MKNPILPYMVVWVFVIVYIEDVLFFRHNQTQDRHYLVIKQEFELKYIWLQQLVVACQTASCASTVSFGTWALTLALVCCLACQCLACLSVYHPFTELHVSELAVTVSHAYCPCAPSSNLSIPPSHALGILHKMCISRAALSPAHAERTCSVALLNTYHGRISASNSPQLQIPANENAQKRERERGRERTQRDTKSAPNPTQTDTTQV